jgi:spore coat polysaccharide biosynthesis protein SpsF
MPRIVASIEARMSSSRLPGKILADIAGRPSLDLQVSRLRQCRLLDDIVVATTISPADDVVETWAGKFGVSCFRGSEEDVLKRVVDAQKSMQSDIVVEVCGDTPLIDPDIVDLAIETFLNNTCQVVSNTNKLSFPQGLDAQVFPLDLLDWVAKNISDPAVREHVSLYFYENPDTYKIFHLMAPRHWKAPEIRLQMDYPEDHQLICEIFERLEPLYGDRFGVQEILDLLKANPELSAINNHLEEAPVR